MLNQLKKSTDDVAVPKNTSAAKGNWKEGRFERSRFMQSLPAVYAGAQRKIREDRRKH